MKLVSKVKTSSNWKKLIEQLNKWLYMSFKMPTSYNYSYYDFLLNGDYCA